MTLMGKPRLILIVRHGESEANIDKSVNGQIPNHLVKLTPRGVKQAQEAGQRLLGMLLPGERVAIYTSPYTRTIQTTDGICESLNKANVDYWVNEEPRLREQDFGNFQGTADEMQVVWTTRARYGHFFYRIPNGESAADVYDRCAGFNETLYRQFEQDCFPDVLVLVSHGIWSRVFLMKWFGWSYTKFETFKNIPHCQFLIMEQVQRPNGKLRYELLTRLATWNDPPEDDHSSRSRSRTPNTLPAKDMCGTDLEGTESDRELEATDMTEHTNAMSKEELKSMRDKEKKIMEMYHGAKQLDMTTCNHILTKNSSQPPSRDSSPGPRRYTAI